MFILTPSRAFFCVLLLWAGVYLPGLGKLELQGEEGRRVLPGIEMLKNGNWVVPHIAGEPYLRKPPLMNWVTAVSQDLGGRNERMARLPSALGVLLFAACLVWLCSKWLGPLGGLLAGVFAISNISMMEKGRLAEIEALYMVFTGLAVLWWLTAWVRGASLWIVWPLAGLFLGLGMLTKGPLHLVFFYSIVVGVLWAGAKRGTPNSGWRGMVHPAHALALVLMLGVFALWAVPYLRMTAALDSDGVWLRQFTGRIGGEMDWSGWLRNFPRGVLNFFPWLVLLPLVWHRGAGAEMPPRMAAVFHGMRSGMVFAFFAVLIVPGSSSRFTMPLIVAPAILLAMVLTHSPGVVPSWLRQEWRRAAIIVLVLCLVGSAAVPFVAGISAVSVTIGIALVAAVSVVLARRNTFTGWIGVVMLSICGMVFATWIHVNAIMPRMQRHDELRTVGAMLNAALPHGEMLTVFRPGFEPFLYYVREPLVYAQSRDDITPTTRLVLVDEEKLERVVTRSRPVKGGPWIRIPARDDTRMIVIELEP